MFFLSDRVTVGNSVDTLIKYFTWAGNVAQLAQYLPVTNKTLGLIPSIV